LKDNAGTFDRLIPLLPKEYSYLAIDLPGHGYSSWIPDGMQYHFIDNIYIVDTLMKEYNWDKISLIGHSLGSILSFTFASVFPKKVDFVVGIDALKPTIFEPVKFASMIENRVDNFILADLRNQEKSEPPSYPIEEMAEKMYKGTNGSVTKECASYLLKRNVRHSTKHPGKFYFARDSRLKFSYNPGFPQAVCIELAKRVNMPYLFIKAKRSPYYEKKEYYEEALNVLKENNPLFEHHLVDSTHHLHLTEPEKISPLISDFILKHKKDPANI
jgi:pimeloyl-ACP methyl ester carboxylesterase